MRPFVDEDLATIFFVLHKQGLRLWYARRLLLTKTVVKSGLSVPFNPNISSGFWSVQKTRVRSRSRTINKLRFLLGTRITWFLCRLGHYKTFLVNNGIENNLLCEHISEDIPVLSRAQQQEKAVD